MRIEIGLKALILGLCLCATGVGVTLVNLAPEEQESQKIERPAENFFRDHTVWPSKEKETYREIRKDLQLKELESMNVSYVISGGDSKKPIVFLPVGESRVTQGGRVTKVTYPLSGIWPFKIAVCGPGPAFEMLTTHLNEDESFNRKKEALLREFQEKKDRKTLGKALMMAAKGGARHISLLYTKSDECRATVVGALDSVVQIAANELDSKNLEDPEGRTQALARTNELYAKAKIGVLWW